MRRSVTFLLCLFLVTTVLVAAGGSVFAAEPSAGIENLLRGSKYEQLLADRRNIPRTVAEKGFLPNLGNYFDPDSEGWGLDIQAVSGVIFAVWFTYNLDGTPTWYIIVATPTASDKGMSVAGNIESFKWDPFGTPGDQATATVVGTMTIAWSDESNADVSWTLDGVAGNASVQHIRFAPPPTPANMTGHYFDPLRSGWGFTVLTQGEVSVLTIYWYKNGQPVWAQGVVTRPGFGGFIDLLYFDGPGLCPSCLAKAGVKGVSTQPLGATLFFNWLLDDPPLFSTGEFGVGGDGPLGMDPLSDIVIPVVAEAITSTAGDSFDPEYEDFINTILDIGDEKGSLCVAFEYDKGIFDGLQVGSLLPAYFSLEPDNGFFPMYVDSICTQPFELVSFGTSDSAPSGLMMAWTGEDGVAYKWSSWFPNPDGGDDDGKEEGFQGVMSVQGAKESKGTLFNIRWYGFQQFILQQFEGNRSFALVDGQAPESLAAIANDPDEFLFTRFVYP